MVLNETKGSLAERLGCADEQRIYIIGPCGRIKILNSH